MQTMNRPFLLAVVLSAVAGVSSIPACEQADHIGGGALATDAADSGSVTRGLVEDTAPSVEDTPAPTRETIEPGPSAVEPMPDAVEPVADPVEPGPDPVEPRPDTIEPVPDTVEPEPGPTEPVPDATEPTRDILEPDPCGDGHCGANENPCSCPEDCLTADTCCAPGDCPQPCCGPCITVECVSFECVELPLPAPCCWNGACEEGETYESCPGDCPLPKMQCEEKGGECRPWDPDLSRCPPGSKPYAYECISENEVCCVPVGPVLACEDFFACESSEDCVKTNAGCCPCNMGGSSVAINAICVDEWRAQIDCPPNLVCPAWFNCDGSSPVCTAGKCKLVGGGIGPRDRE
jgi:hypothetical protein